MRCVEPDTVDEAGFTLLEVTIALVIAALALAVIFHGTVGGIRLASTAGRVEEGVARARAHLAAAQAGPLVPGRREGDEGHGYHWRVQIVRMAAAPTNDLVSAGKASLMVVFAIRVMESWSAGASGRRQVSVQTYRTLMVPQG